jgi:hypothetical protein
MDFIEVRELLTDNEVNEVNEVNEIYDLVMMP